MLNFGYCIWMSPTKNHEWNLMTNGFNIHMSVKTNLNYQQSLDFISNNKGDYNIEVKLIGNYIIDNTDNFHSLFFDVECEGIKPCWWPDDAHISLLYQYNKAFTEDQINHVINNLKNKSIILNNMSINRCDGHFLQWQEVNNL